MKYRVSPIPEAEWPQVSHPEVEKLRKAVIAKHATLINELNRVLAQIEQDTAKTNA